MKPRVPAYTRSMLLSGILLLLGTVGLSTAQQPDPASQQKPDAPQTGQTTTPKPVTETGDAAINNPGGNNAGGQDQSSQTAPSTSQTTSSTSQTNPPASQADDASKQPSGQTPQASTQTQQSSGQPTQQPSSQGSKRNPTGVAAAESEKTSGVAASSPAGTAIAPAKQKHGRALFLKVGAVLGAGVAVGTAMALSHASPSRPPGAR